MKVEKFKIIALIKELIGTIDTYLINFPNKELELKRRIRDSAYDLLFVTYEANVTNNMERKVELQEKGAALIKMIDFLISQ